MAVWRDRPRRMLPWCRSEVRAGGRAARGACKSSVRPLRGPPGDPSGAQCPPPRRPKKEGAGLRSVGPSRASTMSSRRGFTILELVLALLVLSVVASLSIPAYFERSEVTLEKACILLAHDLRAAQNRSAYLGEPALFVFDVEGNGYEVQDELGERIRHPTTREPFVRRFSFDGVFAGVRVIEARFGDDATLLYDRRGTVREGGYVVLGFGTDRRLVQVEPGDGAVHIEGTTSGWRDEGG